MRLVLILGPQAVGKMTVGQELAKITGMKLLHNHMTIDLVMNFFHVFETEQGADLNQRFRQMIFEEVAKSDLPGLIFTYMFDFDTQSEYDYINSVCDIFKAHDAEICFVELSTPFDIRLVRNKTENRLAHKPTKRNISFSESLLYSEGNYRLNTREDEFPFDNYFKLDNSKLSPEAAAAMIKTRFAL